MGMRYSSDPERRSGRTTMQALNVVHLVLDNPGVEVEVNDHADLHPADVMLFELVCQVLRALRVPFHSDRQRVTIVCDGPPQPYTYLEADQVQTLYNQVEQEQRYKPSNRIITF